MKTRSGFVSNSSSSSFVIKKRDLTAEQMGLIYDHLNAARKLCMDIRQSDAWTISETKMELRGFTPMDNFNMREFLKLIDVIRDPVEWGDGYWDWENEEEDEN